MSWLARGVAVTALSVWLAGCDDSFPPLQYGEVTYWRQGRPQGAARRLTSAQGVALSAWLRSHSSGWQPVMATYAPEVLILLVHANGEQSSANLLPSVLIVGQKQKTISVSEHQELLAIIASD